MVFPKPPLAIVGAALLLSAAPAVAQSAPAQPQPEEPLSGLVATKLRDMTTDRPDTTESPFTIDAGHVQIETTILGYERARRDPSGNRAESFEFATTNVRIGVTRSLELDVGVRPFGIAAPGGGAARQYGVGAVDLRAKLNFWGNDGGRTALALLPYVTIPVDRNNGIGPTDIEYGVLVPLSLELGGPFSLGLNVGANARADDPTRGYRVYGVGTASLAVAWSDTVGSYFEIASEAGGGAPVSTSLNTGITWQVGDRVQLDAGTQFGVSGDAPVFAPFIGFSLRL